MRQRRITAESGSPWHLSFEVERVGHDYLCRIRRGARSIDAVALSTWESDRAVTRCLAPGRGHQRGIAAHAAHTLCTATRRRVRCVVGAGLEKTPSRTGEQVARAAQEMALEVAQRLENERLKSALYVPNSPYQKIVGATEELGDEIEQFLSAPLMPLLSRVGAAAADATRQNFDRKIRLFAPLYLCSACSNDCAYCGFRRSSGFSRDRLDPEQATVEAEKLAATGHRWLDLVTGEVATDRFVDYVCEAVRRILDRTLIEGVHLNLGTLSEDQLCRLRESGATGYHLYQETYDPETYFRVHRSGLKRDMGLRLAGPRRALRGGFRFIGLGVLLGLSPLAPDIARLVGHATVLEREFPDARLGFSLPRIREADGDCGYLPAVTVEDDDLIKAFVYLRLKFPRAI